MTHRNQSALVTTDWLASHLGEAGLVILDGGFRMPGAPSTAAGDYAAAHIPGAVFFDIETIIEKDSPLPHMLPSADVFAAQVGALGISNDSFVVVYDGPGLVSAARVWWMFRVFGHDRIAVLDGGLKTWQAEGRPVTTDVPTPKARQFAPAYRPQLLRGRAEILDNLNTKREQVIDARSVGRFNGTEPEPRAGLRGGHIPDSLNLPYGQLTDADSGTIKSDTEIRTLFQTAGLDFDRPVVASCGSGVTACALAFALYLTGKSDVAIYDGSWAEWGQPGDTPVAMG